MEAIECEGVMNTQTDGGNDSLIGDVLAAVTDFSRLAQQAGNISTMLPGTIASDLLERLLQVCEAKRGAIVLLNNDREGSTKGFSSSFQTPQAMTRVLALNKLDEEDVVQLVAAFPSLESGELQEILEIPQWLCWRLAIPTTVAFEQGASGSEGAGHPLALFLLGWIDKVGGKSARIRKKGLIVLPLLADAVSAVIVNLLLAERVQVLEYEMERKVKSRLEDLKSEMLATVNHELRSPLTAIKGYSATLLHHEHRISREERQEFLRAIYDGSSRMEVLIGRLLELSQLETGEFQLRRNVVDLIHLAREAITSVEQRLNVIERSIALQIMVIQPGDEGSRAIILGQDGAETPDELLLFVDRQRLREVFDNLLENAIVYSQDGGVVEIGIRMCDAASGGNDAAQNSVSQLVDLKQHEGDPHLAQLKKEAHVEFWVRDHGIGIGAEHIDHIFERFYRADTRLIREANGLGLGLAICKRIVELHGGLIWVESRPAAGSTFHVLLPAASDEIIPPLSHAKRT